VTGDAAGPSAAGSRRERIARILPVLTWLPAYQRGWLRADLAAGVTLAAYLVPSAIGDASLANLPAEAGLYACLFSGLVFWLFCGSRQTAITVTSALSLLLGTELGALAGGDVARFGALAAGTALFVGLIGILAWLVRAGSVVSFISESVMIGFKAGVALVLASTQLPKLCGIPGGHGSFWERIAVFVEGLGATNPASLGIGLVALAVLLAGRRWLPGRPVALFVVIGGIVATRLFDLGAMGVKVLGTVPDGLPSIALPALDWSVVNQLLPLAFACFLLSAVETAAIGRSLARAHGHRLDADQELLAIGAANLAAGLGGGFPVSGGMSQSLVNESSGARTPVSGLVAALLVLVVVLFLSGLLADLPLPVLAAIVLVAVTGLVKIAAIRRLWQAHRREFAVAAVAMFGVLGSGILRGVLIGAVVSLLLLLRRAARPHVAFLGRIPGTSRFSDRERHADNQPVPGALLFRCEASLLYFNVDAVRDQVWAQCRALGDRLRLVVCDLSTSPHVDVAGAEMLAGLHEDLAKQGVPFRVVEARAGARDMLRLEGLEEKLGGVGRRWSLAQVVEDFERGPAGAERSPAAPEDAASGPRIHDDEA
jgi:high affinity sulfate transporter 1